MDLIADLDQLTGPLELASPDRSVSEAVQENRPALGALCARLLPKDRINRIRYFTATVSARPDNPDAPQRQQVYLRALETIPGLSIHYGHYLTHVTRMPLANPRRGGARTVES